MEQQQNVQAGEHYPFQNKPLPYGYGGLEPYIDTKTMQLHHDRHLQTYIDNLNAAIEPHTNLHNMTLQQLLIYAQGLEDKYPLKDAILRNAGGVYNHFFYFDQLRPGVWQLIIGLSSKLRTAIERDFGSIDSFREKFAAAAMGVFGSGYAWLVVDKQGRLKIITTINQGTPVGMGVTPLLNIDVWEHAYYLKHYNERAKYIADFWSVVDWAKLSAKFDVATSSRS
jgi:Fe-Mn family superoxide dismutase